MKRPRWYVRPASDVLNPRTGRPYAKNHAVPHIAYHSQHAHTATEALVFEWLEKRGRVIGNGRRVLTISRAKLSRELKMPESTVRNCLRSLIDKHSLVQWNAETGKAAPRVRGDFGGVTTWLIPSYTETLKVRRADPAIGKVNNNAYVIGKGKRFLSAVEIAAWKIDAIVAERFSQAEPAAQSNAAIDDSAAADAGPPPDPVAMAARGDPSPSAPGAKRDGKPDLEPLKLAVIAACGEGSASDAKLVWRAIQHEAGARQPAVTVEGGCEMVADVAANWRKIASGKPLTPGLLAKKVRSRVTPWQHQQQHRRNQEVKAAKFARESRINALAEYLKYLARPDLPAEDRGFYQGYIETSDPEELAAAHALLRRQAAG